MKQILIILLAVATLTSCTKKENSDNIYIDFVQVNLNTQLLKTNYRPLQALSIENIPFDDSYTHEIPNEYTAYFVSNEDKGQYTTGQVVKEVEVNKGDNNITVPALSYTVYVSNFEGDNDWYKWPDAVEQLPRTSTELYLIGQNKIDFSTVTTGEVELVNPYAAIMVRDNEWVNGTPHSYYGSQDFTKVNEDWYNLYTRAGETNVKVPIDIPGNYNTNYDLIRSVEPNKIYQYTIDGSVADMNGNLKISVEPMKEGDSEKINL